MSRLTSIMGDLSSRKRRTELRSSSCSSLKAKFMGRSPSTVPGLSGPPGGLATSLSTRRGPLFTTESIRWRAPRPHRRHRFSRPPAGDEPGPEPTGTNPDQGENVPHYEDSLVEVHRVVVGPMDNNVHVIRCKETGEAVLVDAASAHEMLLEMCQEPG